MAQPPIQRYRTIILQPHWMQFVINELPMLIITSVAFIAGGMDEMPLANLCLIIAGLLAVRLLYTFIYLRRIECRINEEQLIMNHGVFTRKSEYLELYRIVDFNGHRTLMQQICGLKTITIYSGDRSTPKLDIIGVKNDLDLASLVRERVELNRRRKGIYEIANR
ncbi:PH domain-containing protein [Parabacteroides sp. GYB001]|uniref:PH domain-containing protein n=1 Tax=Parabacteroides leei TaxID=2939491 RepID=UPI002017BFC6|nr:PH domain-containing protein [Parabacteroides leei]MCL3854221.1 PH domain-containing protein [Parabacteroides leei]